MSYYFLFCIIMLTARSSVWMSVVTGVSSILLSVPLYVGSQLEPYFNLSSTHTNTNANYSGHSGNGPNDIIPNILVCKDTRTPTYR